MTRISTLVLVLFFVFCCHSFNSRAQTVLAAGDIAFSGYNSDDNTANGATSNDDICFILLRSVTTGTQIYFADFGWRSDANAFQSALPCGAGSGAVSDGVVRWTATSNLSYGTQICIRCKVSPTANIGTATGFQGTSNNASEYMTLATGGDQVFAFQGSVASPTLIAGMNMNGVWDATLVNCTFTSSSSTIPPALSTNSYAIAITPEVDNARLKTSVTLTGVAATDRAAIHNPANWDVSDATAFVLPAPITTLPVKFLSFYGKVENGAVKLVWDVATEQQLEGYKVEKSVSGSVWNEIGFIPASGYSSYSWKDPTPASGRNYYRIRSVDTDGGFKFSQVIVMDPGEAKLQIKTSPNPMNDYADVSIYTPDPVTLTIRLMSTEGKVVWQRQSHFAAGTHVIRVSELDGLPGGLYFIQIESHGVGGTKQKTTLIKQ